MTPIMGYCKTQKKIGHPESDLMHPRCIYEQVYLFIFCEWKYKPKALDEGQNLGQVRIALHKIDDLNF